MESKNSYASTQMTPAVYKDFYKHIITKTKGVKIVAEIVD